MTANPLSFHDIEAFSRLLQVGLTAWETDVICQLDDVALRTLAGEVRAKPDAKAVGAEAVPAENVGGLKALLRGLAAKKNRKGGADGHS